MKKATKASTYFTAQDISESSIGCYIEFALEDALERIDEDKITFDMETRYEAAQEALWARIAEVLNEHVETLNGIFETELQL